MCNAANLEHASGEILGTSCCVVLCMPVCEAGVLVLHEIKESQLSVWQSELERC